MDQTRCEADQGPGTRTLRRKNTVALARTFPAHIVEIVAITTSSPTIIIDGGDVVLPDRVVMAGVVVVVSGKIEYAGPPEHLPEKYKSAARRIAAKRSDPSSIGTIM